MSSPPRRPALRDQELSVVIPSFRRPEALRRCLGALEVQTVAPAQVVVAARPGDVPTEQVAGAFYDRMPIKTITVEAAGAVAALNRGLAEIRTPLVAFTDDDAAPRPDWVQRIKEHFQRPEVGAVGGRDIVHGEGEVVDGEVPRVGSIRWFGRVVGYHHCKSDIQEVAFLKGVNMSYRTRLLPGFDDRLAGAGAQVAADLQASLRVHLSGWRVIWDPAVAVDHFPAERFDADARGRPSWRAQVDSVENQVYVLLSLLRGLRRLAVAGYGVAVGYRATPGLLLAPALLVVSRSRQQVVRGLGINVLGHGRGFAAYATRRTQPSIPGPPFGSSDSVRR